MFIEDEHFITSSKVLFASRTALGRRFAAVEGQIQSAVAALTDDETLSIDADNGRPRWPRELAVEAPTMDIDRAELQHLDRTQEVAGPSPASSTSGSRRCCRFRRRT